MKKLIFITNLAFFLISCSQINEKNSNSTITIDSISQYNENSQEKDINHSNHIANAPSIENDTIVENILHYESEHVDTIVDNYHVQYMIAPNGNYVTEITPKGKIYNHEDMSIYMNIKKDETSILDNKEISKKDFTYKISAQELDDYVISSFYIKRLDVDGIVFSINICIPDTDECYSFELQVSEKGRFTITEMEIGEMDGE